MYENVTIASDLKTKLEAGTNVKLMGNVSDCNNMITIDNKEVSLDLNGYSITFKNTDGHHGIVVKNGAKLTISSSASASGSIVRNISDGADSVIGVYGTNSSKSSLIVDDCNISVNDNKGNIGGYGIVAASYSSIESGPNVEITAGYSAISGNGTLKDADVTISGGKYTSNTSAAIFFPSTSTLTVTGGEFIGKTGFDIRAGTVSISDATITLNKDGVIDKTGSTGPSSWGMGVAVIDHSSYAPNSDITVTINNVTVTGETYDIYIGDLNRDATDKSFITTNFDTPFTSNHKISLTVSKDNTNVLEYDAEKSSSIGRIISSIDGVIEVNSIATLQNALKLCSGTIKLSNDISIDKMIEVKNTNILNLNGCTLSTTINNSCLIKIFSTGVLTIIDPESSTKGTITNTAESTNYAVIQCGESEGTSGKAIIKDGVNISSNSGYGILVIDGASLLIENATVTANASAISGNGLNINAKIEIKDGKFTSNTSAAVFFPSTIELTVTGGEFIGATGFDIRAGTVSISGAKITANGNIGTDDKFPASNGPSGWGMGIAVFDHSSYASGSTIDVEISNVTFDCTTCNIFVGKHPGDGKPGDVSFSDTRIFNPNHKINITINDIDFTTKGLYINGVNDVTITGCTFTNISESPISTTNANLYSNAIYLLNCKGNIIIGGADKADGNIISAADASKPMRGIYLDYCGASENSLSLLIQNNTISDVNFNAVQITNVSFSNITISDNTISNWDADAGSNEQPENYEGGRAIRMKLSNIEANVTIEKNIFINSYASNAEFKPSLSKDNITGYDDGNILKTNTNAEFKNNILVLSGIDSYSYVDLFIIGSDENKKMVTFDPNGGYYYTSSEPGVLCSIVAVDSTVSEPVNPSRSGSYSLDGWYDAATGGNKWDFATTISSDKIFYAKWTYTGGSGIPVTPPTDDPEPEPIIPDENNNVTVPSIDDKKADELVHKAVSSGSDSISIIDTNNVEGEYTEVTVSKSDLETISKKIENNNNINSVSIETSEGDIIIEKEVLNSILETTDSDSISFEIEDAKDKLTEEQKEAVGDRPVYDINIKAGNENITSFNGKTITISLPYTLKPGEDPENIVVYYVKEDGSLEKMNCTYKDGKVIFETDHLSKYVIGYEESDKPVTPDTPDDKKDDNNTIYYAVAAIVVILIIIALAYYFMKKKQ